MNPELEHRALEFFLKVWLPQWLLMVKEENKPVNACTVQQQSGSSRMRKLMGLKDATVPTRVNKFQRKCETTVSAVKVATPTMKECALKLMATDLKNADVKDVLYKVWAQLWKTSYPKEELSLESGRTYLRSSGYGELRDQFSLSNPALYPMTGPGDMLLPLENLLKGCDRDEMRNTADRLKVMVSEFLSGVPVGA